MMLFEEPALLKIRLFRYEKRRTVFAVLRFFWPEKCV